ncbi:MAG: hypothetical protein ACJ8KU_00120 [Chthoniobacterales bacterium]
MTVIQRARLSTQSAYAKALTLFAQEWESEAQGYRMRRLTAVFTTIVLLRAAAMAGVTFDLTFPDVVSHTGQNWDDPTYGSQARTTLLNVMTEIGRNLADTATIQLTITSSLTTAYAAGSFYAATQVQPGGFRDGSIYVKIRSGTDTNGSAADGGIEYSFNFAGLHYSDFNNDGMVDMRDFIINLQALTRHEMLHLLGSVSGIDPTNRPNSQATRHDTFLFDSAGRPFVNSDGTVSSVANLDDPQAYFDPVGSGPNFQINAQHDFSHLIGTTFPYRQLVSDNDRTYFATLGYPLAPAAGNLLNISTRMRVGTGDSVLIAGFIVTGLESKQLVIRGIGPSLAASGVNGALADPTLDVYRGNALFTLNDNWRDNQPTELAATGIAPTEDAESATIRTFEPAAYTAIVRGKNNTTGVGSVEVYDLSSKSDSRVVNISTRGFVESGENVMIGGFIIGAAGSQSVDLVVRGIGPSLAAAGVPDVLSDPTLTLYDGNGAEIASNDDWRNTQQAELQASGLAPTNDAESALLITRPAGNATAIVRGKNGAVGNALIEVYRLR